MLIGTADVGALAETAPTVAQFSTEDLHLEQVQCLQLIAEMRNAAREPVLPPALHPTIPAALSIQAYQVGDSPWGAFDLVLCRVSCRSGVRARGYCTAAAASTDVAAQGLRERLGFPTRVADINFRIGYDGVRLSVTDGGLETLSLHALDPEPMGQDDVQYTGTLNLAHTPLGLRLLQVEHNTRSSRVERLRPMHLRLDGNAWGNAVLAPSSLVAATLASMSLTLPAVRFVCKADELAFTGTESVG